jgi:hypothetical protein
MQSSNTTVAQIAGVRLVCNANASDASRAIRITRVHDRGVDTPRCHFERTAQVKRN